MQSGFFLGANSKDGFYSLYHALSEAADKIYIIKGCPGGGKSTFMRRVESILEYPSERIYCSSDPDSLDAVIFPEKRVALVDGTSPHVVEPVFPIACEEYLNLGAFVNPDRLDRAAVKETTLRYKEKFARIYRLTACAGLLSEEANALARRGADETQITKKAAGILAREVRQIGSAGKLLPRFLSAISPKGAVTLFDTVPFYADRVYALEDSYGLAHPLLEEISSRAVALGHTVYACRSPLNPSQTEHLILPEARLAFVTTNAAHPYPHTPTRRLRIDAKLSPAYKKAHRGKLKFAASLSAELVAAACEELFEAKRIHDDLEALYHPCVDFDGILREAEALAKKISGISL